MKNTNLPSAQKTEPIPRLNSIIAIPAINETVAIRYRGFISKANVKMDSIPSKS
jgi:hypothetical protein